jgi:hypothetical protein
MEAASVFSVERGLDADGSGFAIGSMLNQQRYDASNIDNKHSVPEIHDRWEVRDMQSSYGTRHTSSSHGSYEREAPDLPWGPSRRLLPTFSYLASAGIERLSSIHYRDLHSSGGIEAEGQGSKRRRDITTIGAGEFAVVRRWACHTAGWRGP